MEGKRMLVMFAPKAQTKKKGSELGKLQKDPAKATDATEKETTEKAESEK